MCIRGRDYLSNELSPCTVRGASNAPCHECQLMQRALIGATPSHLAAPPYLLDMKAVTKRMKTPNGDIEVLREITLAVTAGEKVAIVGPSGCGKSTLLRLIADLETPTSGRIALHPYHAAASHSLYALVPQALALFPWLTVAQNIAFPLRQRNLPAKKIEELVNEWLAKVSLEGWGSAYPHQLSGGMQQRVALARALVQKSQLLLLDEPFAAVDELTRAGLHQLLLKLDEQSPSTLLLVTHSIDEALLIADRVVVMSARPGIIKANLTVNIQRPRALNTLTASAAYRALADEIRTLLSEEIQPL